MPFFKTLPEAALYCDEEGCPYEWIDETPRGYDVKRSHAQEAPEIPDSDDDFRVVITYGVIRNKREDGGWLPRIWINGRGTGDEWSPRSLDRSEALRFARAAAADEAERWLGDYVVTVNTRKAPARRRS